MKRRKPTPFRKDRHRKHHHFEARIFYEDGEVFGRRKGRGGATTIYLSVIAELLKE
jgi:hypothetical protein